MDFEPEKITTGHSLTRLAAPHIAAEESGWKDADRQTFALRLVRDHGKAVEIYVATRIGEWAGARDQGGVKFWKDIARRVDQILRGSEQ